MKIGLISCGKTKLDHPAPAGELYQGALFKKSKAWALDHCDLVFILSAKHGLLELDEVVAPYEKTLNKTPCTERAEWAERVTTRLPNGEYVYLCGARYREGLPPGEVPMEGLSFGRQLQWLKSQGY